MSSFPNYAGKIFSRSGNTDAQDSQYGYVPSEAIAIVFLVLFAVSTILHIAQAIKFRLWFLLPTAAFCGVIEILGWSGRLWSSFSPLLSNPFTIQICCLIIAPTPLVAANFVILGLVVQRLGPQYSRISAKRYTAIFCTFDVISLVAQGVGGGIASVAASNDENAAPGGHIMLGGIIFQLVTIIIYVCCAIDFYVRYIHDKPIRRVAPSEQVNGVVGRGALTGRIELMVLALSFNTTCLFIRSVYRVIELAGGWGGRVITTEVYFNVCDGAMIVLAIYTLNIAHPGILLGKCDTSIDNMKLNQNAASSEKSV